MGLNDPYSSSRDQIMLIEPLPPLNRVFSMIQQQERQHLMLHQSPTPNLMAMLAKNTFSSFKPNQKSVCPYCPHCKIQGHSFENCFKVGNATPPLCSHCNMTGHSIDKCYKLHGYPPGHKLHGKTKSSTAAVASSLPCSNEDLDKEPTEPMALTKSQYNQLLVLLHSKDSSSAMASISVAPPSTSSNPIHNSKVSGLSFMDNDWDG
ncbi:uncharacterized protein LOC118344323 [Juglans regia]|uniref:Uncharacterized protein LOC118344323 n=1 Tax=Juglans regia TaxID=51240 RepID=A0A6P9E081_JUGRE|nr:uncharacterized protein LOC118344323 [Juglans regia]